MVNLGGIGVGIFFLGLGIGLILYGIGNVQTNAETNTTELTDIGYLALIVGSGFGFFGGLLIYRSID